ncbi:protein of unknown function [Desulfopila aestuarii DSM 18488]|uniref:DUF4410 domain-containing protein n=1 Tax=Desulfopila aestuarii DSM 18488 TaxID=1121416 RepID=A0A1M7YL22_9BACT|nr:protein of unknown function [Desulfopila aestuarii DSM 18488]
MIHCRSNRDFTTRVYRRLTMFMSLFVFAILTACASTTVSDREQLVTETLPRPTHIWVYDFAASAEDIPAHSVLYNQGLSIPSDQTSEHARTGRQLGREIATELIGKIQDMGLLAEHGGPGTKPQINDIEIRGYLISYSEGSTAERVSIGLGAGSSELKAAVEGFQMTAQGLRKLGSGETQAESGKTPGMAIGLVSMLATHNPAGLIISTGLKVYGEESGRDTVEGRAKQIGKEIAEVLSKRFKQEGWIE